MKISLLSAFYPYRGGIAQFGAMLYRELEKNNEVEAITFKRQYPDFLFPGKTQFVTEEDNADAIPAKRLLDTINPFSYGKTAKAINNYQPEVLISQYWMTFFGPAMGMVHKKLKKDIKKVTILHNVIPHEKRFFDKFANRYFLKHNDGFVVLSDAVQKDLLSLVPDAKYLRIDHPVYSQFGEKKNQIEARKELELNTSDKYILFFGFIRDYKGLDLAIQSLKNLPEDFKLLVAGEVYGSFEKYQKQIDDLGLQNRIHLITRYINDDEVSQIFSAADVCLLPYKSATQSGITAISHHFDLPIIATNVGGLQENIKHLKSGLIVEKPDSELIGQAIQEYFEKQYRSQFEQEIRQYKEDNSWGNFANTICKFVEEL